MRPIFLVSLLISLTLCQAGPTPKITEKQQVTEESKVTSAKGEEKLAIEEAGNEKDRPKKSTTTFCVEIRPGAPQLVQTPCICGETQPHVHPEPPKEQPKPEPRPEPAPEPERPAHLVKPEEPLRPQLPNQVIVQPLPDPQETFVLPACEESSMFVMPSNQLFLVPEQELGPPPVLHVPSTSSASSSATLIHPFVRPPSGSVIHVPAPAPVRPATLIHLPSASSSTAHSPLCPQYSKPAYYAECTCRPKESAMMMRSEGSWMEGSMDSAQDPMVSTHHHRQKISTAPMMMYRSPMMPCGNRYVMSSRGTDGRMNEERSGTVISLHTGSHPHSTRLYHDQRRPGFYPYGHSYGTYHPGFGGASASATGIYIDAHPKMYHDMRMMPQGRDMRMNMDEQSGKTEMRDGTMSARRGEESDMSRQLVPREAVDSDSVKDDLKIEIPAENAESAIRNARSEGSKEKNVEKNVVKKENSIKQEKSS